MASSSPPPIVVCLPEPDLQLLRDRYELSRFPAKANGDLYRALVESAYESLSRFLGYDAPCVLVRAAIAPAIVQRRDFLDHVVRVGGITQPDADLLGKVATAAAGTLAAKFLGGPNAP